MQGWSVTALTEEDEKPSLNQPSILVEVDAALCRRAIFGHQARLAANVFLMIAKHTALRQPSLPHATSAEVLAKYPVRAFHKQLEAQLLVLPLHLYPLPHSLSTWPLKKNCSKPYRPRLQMH